MPIKKINEFPSGSGSLTNDDVFLFMDDPSGSGITKKISLTQTGFIRSNTNGIAGASGIYNIVQMSQASYDALATKDPNTLYAII
jgi:hypothetical protein